QSPVRAAESPYRVLRTSGSSPPPFRTISNTIVSPRCHAVTTGRGRPGPGTSELGSTVPGDGATSVAGAPVAALAPGTLGVPETSAVTLTEPDGVVIWALEVVVAA